MKAIWNNRIIAESDKTRIVEQNRYFPLDSVNMQFLQKTETSSICPWKGTANYYTIQVDGKTNRDAAWYYSDPKDAARNIQNWIAFWKDVQIIE